MDFETSRYTTKAEHVIAVRLGEHNIQEIGEYLGAQDYYEPRKNGPYKGRDALPRLYFNEGIAYLGDWIVFVVGADEYDIYTDDEFTNKYQISESTKAK